MCSTGQLTPDGGQFVAWQSGMPAYQVPIDGGPATIT